jgi:hypothetical protein
MPAITKYTETRIGIADPQGGPVTSGEFRVFMKMEHPDHCEFLCPCGCERRCVLFLRRPDREPAGDRKYWNYSPGPTLEPSVWWDSGCKAHFTLTNGTVIFV